MHIGHYDVLKKHRCLYKVTKDCIRDVAVDLGFWVNEDEELCLCEEWVDATITLFRPWQIIFIFFFFINIQRENNLKINNNKLYPSYTLHDSWSSFMTTLQYLVRDYVRFYTWSVNVFQSLNRLWVKINTGNQKHKRKQRAVVERGYQLLGKRCICLVDICLIKMHLTQNKVGEVEISFL